MGICKSSGRKTSKILALSRKVTFLINFFMSLNGTGSQGVIVWDLQHLVYIFRGNGEKDFTIRGDDSPLTFDIRGMTLEEELRK